MHQVVLLFGGWDGKNALNDTWAWDGSEWQQLETLTAPSPRQAAHMVYNPINQQIILFGGWQPNGQDITSLNDSWTWDGSHWNERSSGKPGSGAAPAASLVYDGAHFKVLMWQYGSGLWTWSGQTWRSLKFETGPSLYTEGVLGYDEASQALLLFGWERSDAASEPQAVTWSWDGEQWTKIETRTQPAPGPSSDLNMLYDAQHEALLLFSTQRSKIETRWDAWGWTGSDWQQIY